MPNFLSLSFGFSFFFLFFWVKFFNKKKKQRSFKVVFDNVTVSTDPEWAQMEMQIKEFNGDSTLDVYLNVLKTIINPKVTSQFCFISLLIHFFESRC